MPNCVLSSGVSLGAVDRLPTDSPTAHRFAITSIEDDPQFATNCGGGGGTAGAISPGAWARAVAAKAAITVAMARTRTMRPIVPRRVPRQVPENRVATNDTAAAIVGASYTTMVACPVVPLPSA